MENIAPAGLDIARLRKVVDWAVEQAARPEQESEWEQGSWAQEGEDLGRSCGTAYCIAGKLIADVDGEQALWDMFREHPMENRPFIARGAEILGVTPNECWGVFTDASGKFGSGTLFAPENTIHDVREQAARLAERYGERL